MAQLHPAADRRDLDHPPEDMGEREEEQCRGLVARLGVEDRLPAAQHRVRLEHEVGVGDHTSLGAAGGTRGVDHRGHGVRGDRPAVPVHHLVVETVARREQLRHRVGVELPEPFEPGQPVDHRTDGHGVVLVLHQTGRDLGVVEHPVDLLGGGGGIDGYGLGADGPEREVEERPLVAGTGHDRDAVPEPYAVREQPLGQPEHVVTEGGGGHVPPSALLVLAAEDDMAGSGERVLEDGVREPADMGAAGERGR